MQPDFAVSPPEYNFAEIQTMEKKSTSLYWILFFLSIALSVAVYLFLPSMISLTLVPITTFLVKALDII
jgi:hypothetical protein